MALDAATAQALIEELNSSRERYVKSVEETCHHIFRAIGAAKGGSGVSEIPDITPPNITEDLSSCYRKNRTRSKSLSVETSLQQETYTEEGFREHLQTFDWTERDKDVLEDLARPMYLDEYLKRRSIFQQETSDRPSPSHLKHCSIIDIGSDGRPVSVLDSHVEDHLSRSEVIWNKIRSTNVDDTTSKAVGRITIVREPSPLVFAALHYTFSQHFNMDDLFSFLVEDEPVLSCHPDPFSDDDRLQRSFVFTMAYSTIVDRGCKPMRWQMADRLVEPAKTYIPMSRCSSVIALSLESVPMKQVDRALGNAKNRVGHIYDPFSPWRLLSMTAYPDLRGGGLDTHDAYRHCLNGPEAFLITLYLEFKDAVKRLTEVYEAITHMLQMPSDFISNPDTRDSLLFEDDRTTYLRRYNWAHHTLMSMNKNINDMIEAYFNSFSDDVWAGTDEVIWPGEGTYSAKHDNWRKRMKVIRKYLEREIASLQEIEQKNSELVQTTIKDLRKNLTRGTLLFTKRRMIEAEVSREQQARNIRLLTLTTVCFLPLVFVASAFGMKNIPQHGSMIQFAYTVVSICIPTYILIGTLSSNTGSWWMARIIYLPQHITAAILDMFNYRPYWTLPYRFRRAEEQETIELAGRLSVSQSLVSVL